MLTVRLCFACFDLLCQDSTHAYPRPTECNQRASSAPFTRLLFSSSHLRSLLWLVLLQIWPTRWASQTGRGMVASCLYAPGCRRVCSQYLMTGALQYSTLFSSSSLFSLDLTSSISNLCWNHDLKRTMFTVFAVKQPVSLFLAAEQFVTICTQNIAMMTQTGFWIEMLVVLVVFVFKISVALLSTADW